MLSCILIRIGHYYRRNEKNIVKLKKIYIKLERQDTYIMLDH